MDQSVKRQQQKHPPFPITSRIFALLHDIAKELGALEGRKLIEVPLTLLRANNIQTIHASLAIEENTLTLDQVTDLLNSKRVLGPLQDILW